MIRALFIIFIVASAHAQRPEVYRFKDTLVLFHRIEGFLVNKGCRDCEALSKAIEHAETALPAEELRGGRNPWDVKCRRILGGRKATGLDLRGRPFSFCQFKDDSYLGSH